MESIKQTAALLLLFCLISCSGPSIEEVKHEIVKAEKAFCDMAAQKGVSEAFLAFAAEDAVLMRNNQIIKGKDAIRDYNSKSTLQQVKLIWHPEFVDVSGSMDMAYTYGPYEFSAVDTAGNEIKAEGIFHTVWKRQGDGSWKYVYD